MLYNKIVGQNEIKNYLIKSVNEKSLSHGYIFEGPKSIGKIELAKVFAQSIFCENFGVEPCNKCNACKKINTDNHPDLHIIDIEDESIKRELVDQIIESVYIKPYEADKKIYIINNSHNMTLQAANTFLKTLEEPPKDTVIILLSTNSELLLPTIVSRCQVIKFKRINKNEIKKLLINKYDINDQRAQLIAEYSKGILNKAIRIYEGKDDILSERDEIVKIIDELFKSSPDIIYEYENYFEKKKNNMDDTLELIMIWLRDIAFIIKDMDDLVINKDSLILLKKHSENTTLESITDMIQYIQNVSFDIKKHVNYKLVIDKMLLKLQEV